MTATLTLPAWERRYRAPSVFLPDWAADAPNRIVYVSNESGVWQVHCRDLATGATRQVTDHPVGVTDGRPTIDGTGVLWFSDASGDESGQWQVAPFDGGEPRVLLTGIPDGWNEGMAERRGIVAAAVSDRDGFAVYVARDGGPAVRIALSPESLRVAGAEDGGVNRAALSADGTLLCLEHSDDGDLLHPALRVIETRSGAIVGELRDAGMALRAAAWSPIPGGTMLAIVDELDGHERPALWDPTTGERRRLAVDLPGEIAVTDWYPAGDALLLKSLHEGRDRLYRYDLATGATTAIAHPAGTVAWTAHVRPDGEVWFRLSQGHAEPRILADDGREVIAISGDRAPAGRPFVSWHFRNEHGQDVHGFHVAPEGTGPFPTIMLVHGGPTWLDMDRFYPEAQAYVDAGFAVGLVNYRGSTGYGRAWRDALTGDIGGPELEDVNAGLRDLVGRGIADPARAVIAGWSWGGYTTLMEVGKHSDLWRCGVAGVPIGDYVMSYDDMAPILQAYDRALLGGTPAEVPELMADRNPINHVDKVSVPVLFLIGENDSRCPYRQAMAYVDRLAARGAPHEVYVFGTGHGSNDTDERIRQQRIILDFLAAHVPGIDRAAGGMP
jgi:dipeptidyl aminopeptidase/acylaminoacyl peptidase